MWPPIDQHFKGLNILLVRGLLQDAATAERLEHAADGGRGKHAEGNAIKEKAREHYLTHKTEYKRNQAAAAALFELFGTLTFRTYCNLVTEWSKE